MALAKGDETGHCLQIGQELYIDPEDPGRRLNHSCAPNAGIMRDFDVVAIRDIKKSDEITIDYSTTMDEDIWVMECQCGGDNCRRTIKDFKCLPRDLQKKYLSLGVVQNFIANKYQTIDHMETPTHTIDQHADFRRGVDFIGVNCVFWCHDGSGRVLMHKRSQKCRDEQGTWDCGAGAMEFGETFDDTIRREVMEEYGATPLQIVYVTTRNVLREHNGRATHWIKNLHWVQVDPAQVSNREPEKIDELGWFTFDTLPAPLHSQIGIEIDLIKKFLNSRH